MTPRMRSRGRWAALLAGAALASAPTACSSPATSSAPPGPAAHLDPGALLTAADLGPGWAEVGADATALPCSAPRTGAALVGPGGAVVRLALDGGPPSVVEYASRQSSPAAAYVSAVDRLQTSASCATVAPTRSATSRFVGVLPLPKVGLHSVCMVFADTTDGVAYQSAFEVVREGPYLVVVGTTAAGPPDVAGLQHATALALAKLGG